MVTACVYRGAKKTGLEMEHVLEIAIVMLLLSLNSALAGNSRGGIAPVIFNFGDSNSDTGGLAAAMGFKLSPPESRVFFGHPTGRFCDGRLIIDFLCQSLNTSFLSPYLKSVGSEFSNGADFAIAGATVLPGSNPFSLNIQVQQFLYFKARSLELINQGANGPINDQGFQNALYTVDIGQNDVNALFSYLTYDQVLAKIPPIVAGIQSAIQTLYDNGGRNFWIHGTGALGCLPQKLAIPGNNNSAHDENGCLTTYNNAAKAFNAQLSSLCNQMSSKLNGSTIVYTDLFAIKYDLVANHSKYGFTYPLMTCCGYGGPPYNYDPNRSCMNAGAQLSDDDFKYISWDGVHLTEAANAIVAAMILTGDFSKPKLKFDYFCTA